MTCQYYYQAVIRDSETNALRRAEEGERAEMFSVYWREKDGTAEWIADFLFETDAADYVKANNHKVHRIVVDVKGGVVQSIYGDKLPREYQFEFIVRDWDNIEAGDLDPLGDDYKAEEYFW